MCKVSGTMLLFYISSSVFMKLSFNTIFKDLYYHLLTLEVLFQVLTVAKNEGKKKEIVWFEGQKPTTKCL